MNRTTLILIVLATLITACGTSVMVPEDTQVVPDGGHDGLTVVHDAGQDPDAQVTPGDAGGQPDAADPTDAQDPTTDAQDPADGAVADAGTTDGGVTYPDAGVVLDDGGFPCETCSVDGVCNGHLTAMSCGPAGTACVSCPVPTDPCQEATCNLHLCAVIPNARMNQMPCEVPGGGSGTCLAPDLTMDPSAANLPSCMPCGRPGQPCCVGPSTWTIQRFCTIATGFTTCPSSRICGT